MQPQLCRRLVYPSKMNLPESMPQKRRCGGMGAQPCTSAGWQRSASSLSASPRAAVIWSITPQGAPAATAVHVVSASAQRQQPIRLAQGSGHLVHHAAGCTCSARQCEDSVTRFAQGSQILVHHAARGACKKPDTSD